MAISSFYCKLFVIICCSLSSSSLSFVLTMSVHKTAGSEYFGILPAKYAKVTHRNLPPPTDEGYQFITDVSYYFSRANNQVGNLFRHFFGTSDREDPQIGQGVYKCAKGVCKMLPLDHQQTLAFHEKLKGKKIQTGNVLTDKVQQLDEKKD